MNVKNCPVCGKMYVVSNSSGMCDVCREAEEAGFMEIKEFIEKNNSATMGEISDATGVSVKRILGYVREGRLMATPTMSNEIACKSCNGPVISGNFCEDCTLKLNRGIQNLYSENEKVQAKLTGIKMNIKGRT